MIDGVNAERVRRLESFYWASLVMMKRTPDMVSLSGNGELGEHLVFQWLEALMAVDE